MGYIIDQYVMYSNIKELIASCYVEEIKDSILPDVVKERKSVVRYFGKQKSNYKNKKGKK